MHSGIGVNLVRLGFVEPNESRCADNELGFIRDPVSNIEGGIDTKPSRLIFRLAEQF